MFITLVHARVCALLRLATEMTVLFEFTLDSYGDMQSCPWGKLKTVHAALSALTAAAVNGIKCQTPCANVGAP